MTKRFLEESEIKTMFNKFILKDPEYFKQFSTAEDLSNSLGIDLKNMDAPRAFAVADFRDWIEKYNINPKHTLSTWKDDHELQFLKTEELTEVRYDGENYDLHSLDLEKKDFDFVLFSQTLEHLNNPSLALSNLRKHMCRGGYIFTSVPTINIPHCLPSHFQHFTPMGLATLFKLHKFEVLEIGFWGNFDYIQKLFLKFNWPDVFDLTSIDNDPMRHVQCWILARK